ncbi:hypothetical protein GYMLUDRAFT_60475 [Collybiopsis luxurians FD-317 M1]|uniref:Uncharacterized protein n=1 Tax=Collybiopsis luxurians FD-317 M1 TaxID=944289 RepID=A0A0D0CJT7_9AGAR|nr:hypothetical protein GYMLUDRAFT_60475 [Collybiopsis luxurians FD-317 M1]
MSRKHIVITDIQKDLRSRRVKAKRPDYFFAAEPESLNDSNMTSILGLQYKNFTLKNRVRSLEEKITLHDLELEELKEENQAHVANVAAKGPRKRSMSDPPADRIALKQAKFLDSGSSQSAILVLEPPPVTTTAILGSDGGTSSQEDRTGKGKRRLARLTDAFTGRDFCKREWMEKCAQEEKAPFLDDWKVYWQDLEVDVKADDKTEMERYCKESKGDKRGKQHKDSGRSEDTGGEYTLTGFVLCALVREFLSVDYDR